MAVLNIFSPGKLTVGGSGANFQTQFVSNPWGSGAVWIQCTTKYIAGDGQSDFGIQEIDFLDDQGLFHRQSFGGADSPYDSLLARRYVPRLLGVTVAANTYDAAIEGTLTLFQWGVIMNTIEGPQSTDNTLQPTSRAYVVMTRRPARSCMFTTQ